MHNSDYHCDLHLQTVHVVQVVLSDAPDWIQSKWIDTHFAGLGDRLPLQHFFYIVA